MFRDGFYSLFINVLNTIEDDCYMCIVKKDKKVEYKDINYSRITISDVYSVVNSKNDSFFVEDVKKEEYLDFGYCQEEKSVFPCAIIGIDEIRNVLVQNVMEFPYLYLFYKMLENKFNNRKNSSDIINISDGEKNVIIATLKRYYEDEKRILGKLEAKTRLFKR